MAPNLNALRTLLDQTFKSVYYIRADREDFSLHLRVTREAHVPAGTAFLEPHLREGGLAHPDLGLPKVALGLDDESLLEGLPS
jgi:hypothetical protein